MGHWPATDSQGAALDCKADLLLFGGAAGSLKTATALVSLIQERDAPRMQSYFFRRTFPAMEGAMQQAHDLFPQLGGRSVDRVKGLTRTWEFPSGATFRFRQLANQQDLDDNYGKEMSAIAFDESTHWEEKYPRQILARNRSTDPDLKIRAIFTTNPGNRGHKWHMKLWMGGVCPHCEPHKAPKQGVLHWDGKWPSDGRPLEYKPQGGGSGKKLSIAYILGSIYDHSLLGEEYVARLFMQSPNTAKALLEGCWRVFEGQYFDCFSRTIGSVEDGTCVVRRPTVREQWWWTFWAAGDYGFSGSAAAAGLFCRTEPILPRWPNGRILLLDEYPSDEKGARRERVIPFTQNVYNKFFKKQDGEEQAKRILDYYMSPDSWNDRGDDHTLADQMDKVLEEHGLSVSRADNDRAGGASLMYSLIESGEFGVCDSCPNTIESLESRIVDPDEPVKVFKNVSDPLDDYFDMARYGLYSDHKAPRKPLDDRVKERLAAMYKDNPTAAMIQAQMIMQQEKQSGSSQVYTGNARRLANEIEKSRKGRF